MPSHHNILIIEDDLEFAGLVKTFLESEGYAVAIHDKGREGIQHIQQNVPDLCIVDMMLPDMTGMDICKTVRDSYPNPILMLTANDQEMLEVAAINSGFDDYIAKPIRPNAMLARIKALLRRQQPMTEKPPSQTIRYRDIELDSHTQEATKQGETLALNRLEYRLLHLFIHNVGESLSRNQIYQDLRGIDYDGTDRYIDTTIASLRKKLGEHDSGSPYIKTLRGEGYILLP